MVRRCGRQWRDSDRCILESVVIAEAVEPHVAAMEVIANIAEFLVELLGALTCIESVKSSVGSHKRSTNSTHMR
jgi:hypothetical protein